MIRSKRQTMMTRIFFLTSKEDLLRGFMCHARYEGPQGLGYQGFAEIPQVHPDYDFTTSGEQCSLIWKEPKGFQYESQPWDAKFGLMAFHRVRLACSDPLEILPTIPPAVYLPWSLHIILQD